MMQRMTIALVFLFSTLPSIHAYAQSGKFCDPSWCRALDKMERAQWGKKLVDAVAALHLSPRYRLKPRQIKPAIPWLAKKRKKIAKKVLVGACPQMAPGFKSGSFPYPLKFLGVFDLPRVKKKTAIPNQWVRIQLELLPGPAGIPDLENDKYIDVRDRGANYLIWEKSWVMGSARKRPDLTVDLTIVVGQMKKGAQVAPDGSSPMEQVAEAKSVTIRLHGPRKIVDAIVRHTDLKKLEHLLDI